MNEKNDSGIKKNHTVHEAHNVNTETKESTQKYLKNIIQKFKSCQSLKSNQRISISVNEVSLVCGIFLFNFYFSISNFMCIYLV